MNVNCLIIIRWIVFLGHTKYESEVVFSISTTGTPTLLGVSSAYYPEFSFDKNYGRALIKHFLSEPLYGPSVPRSLIDVGNREVLFDGGEITNDLVVLVGVYYRRHYVDLFAVYGFRL